MSMGVCIGVYLKFYSYYTHTHMLTRCVFSRMLHRMRSTRKTSFEYIQRTERTRTENKKLLATEDKNIHRNDLYGTQPGDVERSE